MQPQTVTISSEVKLKRIHDAANKLLSPPCPYKLRIKYFAARGGYRKDSEQFFVFKDGSPVLAKHLTFCLKLMLKLAGFDPR